MKQEISDLTLELRKAQKTVLAGIDLGAAEGDPKKTARAAKAAIKEMFAAMETLMKLFATSQR
jgi:hypothetical protein